MELSFLKYALYFYSNLDETTKSVYKENVRLSEALNYHMKEGELLTKERDRLLEENNNFREEKEVTDLMVQEKVVQVKQQKETIKEVCFFLSLATPC